MMQTDESAGATEHTEEDPFDQMEDEMKESAASAGAGSGKKQSAAAARRRGNMLALSGGDDRAYAVSSSDLLGALNFCVCSLAGVREPTAGAGRGSGSARRRGRVGGRRRRTEASQRQEQQEGQSRPVISTVFALFGCVPAAAAVPQSMGIVHTFGDVRTQSPRIWTRVVDLLSFPSTSTRGSS